MSEIGDFVPAEGFATDVNRPSQIATIDTGGS